MDSTKFFSETRLASYKNEREHKDNFLLMQILAPKLAILEIATRNLTFEVLKHKNKLEFLAAYNDLAPIDDTFISRQTFGFWAKIINEARIHNDLVDLSTIDFRKYSKFNIKFEWRNYQKVKIVYDLAVKIRNRAFHFENLYKLNDFNAPRVSTRIKDMSIGIMPEMLESFIDDILDCYDINLKDYLK